MNSALESALSLHRQGRLQEAAAAYHRALASAPRDARALSGLGVAMLQIGRPDAAVEPLRAALRVAPDDAQTWSHLAFALDALGQTGEALEASRQAVQRAPRVVALWNNLCAAYLTLGQAHDAEAAARRAIEIDARDAASWFNLALSLQASEKLEPALDAVTRACALEQRGPAPEGLKAQLEASLGRLVAARATIAGALARHRGVAALHLQAADIATRDGNLVGAAREQEAALALEPANGVILSELVFLRKRVADWRSLDALRRRFREGVAAGAPGLTPFSFLSDPSTRAEQRRCATLWGAAFQRAEVAPTRREVAAAHLRIGYLSSDFHQHATAVLAAGVFEAHDSARFAITAYSTGPEDGSPMRRRLTKAFASFVDARGWPAAALAQRIRDDGIDILVDLKGYTDNARTDVGARRPAPIQVNYLGYPGTLGAPFVDYLIGDPVVTPPEHQSDYAEALVLMPASYQPNDGSEANRAIAPAPPRAELGLPEHGTVFCCFNAAFKFNPDVMDAWARILAAAPGSVLWLLAGADDPARDVLAENLRREAAARGLDPARLVFAGRRPYSEYLGLYRRADLFLDTWPYNAHTTASDALWAGCPVLTWLGETFAGRVAASLLSAVGLPELVTRDVEHYVERAIALAADRPALVRLRTFLDGPGRRSPLFDTVTTTRALEAAYVEMAAQYRRGARMPIRIAHPKA